MDATGVHGRGRADTPWMASARRRRKGPHGDFRSCRRTPLPTRLLSLTAYVMGPVAETPAPLLSEPLRKNVPEVVSNHGVVRLAFQIADDAVGSVAVICGSLVLR